MRQYPIYVDAPGGYVAAVVTAPDGDPRGIVLTLAGTGRHNLVGSTLCAHLSKRVADEGFASVRFDFVGVGDSPGLVPEWSLSDVGDATEQARAALAAARDALGVDRFVTVGTCYGSRVALGLAGDAGSAGAVCLAPPILDYGGLSRIGRQVGERSSVGELVRSNAALRRLAAPLRRKLRPSKAAPRLRQALASRLARPRPAPTTWPASRARLSASANEPPIKPAADDAELGEHGLAG